jgi:hypothetical protein
MDFRMAAISGNAAAASTAQSVATGIEIAASKPGGLGSISDSFQEIPSAGASLEPASKFAPSAAMEMPNQYFTRLNDFHRDASGLVPTKDLEKSMKDVNLNLEASLEYFIGVSSRLVKGDVQKDIDQLQKELEELKKQKDEQSSGFWNEAKKFITGDDAGAGGSTTESQAIQQMLSRFEQAQSLSSTLEKKYKDTSSSIAKKLG